MNISDHISESLETIFGLKIFEFYDADPDQGSRIFMTLDAGSRMEKFGSGIRDKHPVRDKHPGSATLQNL